MTGGVRGGGALSLRLCGRVVGVRGVGAGGIQGAAARG